jgi:putative tricarboxylic transport membrane protein
MSEASQGRERGPYHRQVEIGVAIATALFGLIVMIGSLQVGITWGVEGPRSGFFPFYVGLFIVLSSAVNLVLSINETSATALFAEWGQLRLVMSVVIPTAAYVLVMPYLGIYVSSTLLIALFMKWLGRYPWRITLTIAVAVPVITYVLFEKWFLVPLPKGPIEDLLGL